MFLLSFHHNPDGQLRLIYPDSFPSNGLASGTQLTVPPGDQWFEFDEQTGTETFHVLVSPTPLRSIETLYEDYRQQASEVGTRRRALSLPSNGCAINSAP